MSKDEKQDGNKSKNFYEGKRQKPSKPYVSLDNADTVIEGAPSFADSGKEWDLPGALPVSHF